MADISIAAATKRGEVMTTAKVFGIIGGIIALIIGAAGYSVTTGLEGLGDAAHNFNQSQGFNTPKPSSLGIFRLASLVLPIVAIVGAVLIGKNGKLAAGLMGGSAVLMVVTFGFGFFTLVPCILLGVAAVLALKKANPAN